MNKHVVSLALATALSAGVASAQSTFEALLTGSGETSPTGSPATGFGTVVLNAAQNQITVDESWSGLLAAATASHIHGPGGVGTNAGFIFAFSGVPAATSGSIPQQVFAITPTEVGYLQSGYLYLNVHTSQFPGGEIRGQLVLVPEPSTAALLVLGAGATALALRRRKVSQH
jgi:hypothetical protein